MPNQNSQSTRGGKLTTTLGEDVLVLLDFSGSEAINALFSFRVQAHGAGAIIDFDKVLGRAMGLEFKTIESSLRYFDGIVTAARYLGGDDTAGHDYEFELSPWLWFLDRRHNSRIFKEKTVQDIIADVFADYATLPSHEAEWRITGSYPKLGYCVQYRESDLDFVRRLLEEFGINFHFEMRKGNHLLVLSDNAEGFKPLPGTKRPYYPVSGHHRATSEHFKEWAQRRRVTTGEVRLTDYNFELPTTSLLADAKNPLGYDNGARESYDYPGRYSTQADGKKLAARRLDGFRAQDAGVSARGDVLTLGAGLKVTLTEHTAAQNGEYICTSASHHYTGDGYRSGVSGTESEAYDGFYGLAKADAPLAPPRITPRALVRGPQTGVVIGKGEIDCDAHGRIEVMFHWDTAKAGSMRCRVAQSWAGKNWGTVYIPRVGMEVVVEFLEGDPDRPLVTGCVYNGQNTPPFGLPDNKTISGIKSYSTTGGGGYNQLTFEDKKGSELIEMHAQKDLKTLVENNETREVKKQRSTTIGGSDSETVGGDVTLTIRGTRDTKIDKTDKLHAKQDIEIESVTKITLKVGGSSIVMDGGSIEISAGNIKVQAGMQLETSAGLTAKHTAGAMMDIVAALVKINS